MEDKANPSGIFKEDAEFKDAGHGKHSLHCPACKQPIGSLELTSTKVSLYIESERDS